MSPTSRNIARDLALILLGGIVVGAAAGAAFGLVTLWNAP